jgi:hypothetical protein
MRRIISVVFLFAFAGTMLFAAGSKEAATSGAATDYTVQVLVSPTTVKEFKDTVVGKVIYDKFKINFEPISYAGDIR